MFSITMAALPLRSPEPFDLPRGVAPLSALEAAQKKSVLSLGWPSLDALLPDGGLPRGVVEIAARGGVGGSSRIAARAVAVAHARSAQAFAAWIDPESTLHAPGLARASVDLSRLFVVRPPRPDLGRIAVKVARAGAFAVVVVDMDPITGADTPWLPSHRPKTRRPLPPEVVVRKLALAAEEGECTVLLLTDSSQRRAVPWPVSLRLELERRPDALSVRVAKDHRGRSSLARTWVPVTELARTSLSRSSVA